MSDDLKPCQAVLIRYPQYTVKRGLMMNHACLRVHDLCQLCPNRFSMYWPTVYTRATCVNNNLNGRSRD